MLFRSQELILVFFSWVRAAWLKHHQGNFSLQQIETIRKKPQPIKMQSPGAQTPGSIYERTWHLKLRDYYTRESAIDSLSLRLDLPATHLKPEDTKCRMKEIPSMDTSSGLIKTKLGSSCGNWSLRHSSSLGNSVTRYEPVG